MSDLFHIAVPDSFLDLVFASMAKASQHTFLVLTKRPERMRNYILKAMCDADCNYDGLYAALDELGIPDANPMENIWIGVSVKNQASADERIPLLLQTPATVRFISAEPLLGPIDLNDLHYENVTAVDALNGLNGFPKPHTKGPKLDWVIVGGESGPRARPMHPDWVRSLRDQCQAAGTKLFFKQWGEWTQSGQCGNIRDDAEYYHKDKVERINHDGGMGYHGAGAIYMQRVGKKKAGRELDGRTWDELPEVKL